MIKNSLIQSIISIFTSVLLNLLSATASKKTPKFRLQKNVHEELVKRGGYYIFKQGETMLKIDAKDVTPLLKPGKWSFDRKPEYAYKFLACEKIGLKGEGVLDKVAKSAHASAVEYYSKYFTS